MMIPLKMICDAIEMADDAWKHYLDIEEMNVVSLPDTLFMGEYDEEDQELAERIEEGWRTRYFALPSKFDIHEYRIMEEFVWELPQGRVQDSLEKAIRGKGAFRRFKDGVHRFGMEQQWYDFQEAAYRRIAVRWCEDHGFEYCEEAVNGRNASGGEANGRDWENLAWKEIRTEHVVQDEWIDFRRSAYRFPDGNVFEPFYSYSRKDYVVIVATDEGEGISVSGSFGRASGKLLRNFRQGESRGRTAGSMGVTGLWGRRRRRLMRRNGNCLRRRDMCQMSGATCLPCRPMQPWQIITPIFLRPETAGSLESSVWTRRNF